MLIDSAGNDHFFSTRWLGKSISVQVNKGFIEFYGKYPQVDLEVYANAVPDPKWTMQIKRSLSPLLEDRDEYEATAALSNFMHKSFPYAYDDEQPADGLYRTRTEVGKVLAYVVGVAVELSCHGGIDILHAPS